MSFLGVGLRSLELNLVSPIKCVKFGTFIFVNAHFIILFQFLSWVFVQNIFLRDMKFSISFLKSPKPVKIPTLKKFFLADLIPTFVNHFQYCNINCLKRLFEVS